MVWSTDRASTWYAAQGEWKQGVNYVPSYAANQIQMWQDYDADHIRRELTWAADLGYNALRVFLHDQLYTVHGSDFLDRVDDFLDLAHGLGFQTILVLLEGMYVFDGLIDRLVTRLYRYKSTGINVYSVLNILCLFG